MFKRTFEQIEQAAGLIQALLPPDVTAQLDIGTLEVVPGTFIDAELRELESDLLYRVALGGRPAFVYVLLEHQSSIDVSMPWRLLRYMVRIWDAMVARASKHQRLPVMSAAEEKFYERMAPFLLEAERRESRADGLREVERKGLVKALLVQLTHRFGPLSPEHEARVSAASTEDVQRMFERALDAKRIEDALG